MARPMPAPQTHHATGRLRATRCWTTRPPFDCDKARPSAPAVAALQPHPDCLPDGKLQVRAKSLLLMT